MITCFVKLVIIELCCKSLMLVEFCCVSYSLLSAFVIHLNSPDFVVVTALFVLFWFSFV